MKVIKYLFFIILILGQFSCNKDESLTQSEAIEGLKEALKIGTNNSVSLVSVINGYYGNQLIKIPFPEDAIFIKDAINNYLPIANPLVDTLVLKLNRAAENAATKAQPIFIKAITDMSILDALNILKGGDNAATEYLKKATYTSLKIAFKPDIQNSLDNVGATVAWTTITTKYNSIPDIPFIYTKQPVNTDLAEYTTDKALDGLFVLIANEEKQIRKDPAKRVNDLLKKVFAEQNTQP